MLIALFAPLLSIPSYFVIVVCACLLPVTTNKADYVYRLRKCILLGVMGDNEEF